MKKRCWSAVLMMFWCVGGWAQQADIMAKLGYPPMIIYNGKIVTVDDASFESRVGTIVQAMAIRDGKILATGSDAEIRPLAGPQTRVIDLKGRTVLPGFLMTHEHPTDWAFSTPRAMTHALPNDDVIVHRWLRGGPARDQLIQFEPTLKEAVAKARPGQWILIGFSRGPNYEWIDEVSELFRTSIKKEWLDTLAPNNPVKIKNGFVGGVANQSAIDETLKVHPDISIFSPTPVFIMAPEEFFKTGSGFSRAIEPDVMLQGKVPVLAEILKAEMEVWARYGITTFASAPYAYNNLVALDYLDKKGEMPARFAWGYLGPDFSMDTLRQIAAMTGHGTDHLWLTGAWAEIGSECMSIPLRAGQEDARAAQGCNFAPGAQGREILERIIATGNRVATMHTGGDKDIDYYMDMIEQASQRAGLTLEEIRAKRHTFDHGGGAPRPDQILRMKNLGMMASQNNTYLWSDTAKLKAERYGIEYANWVVPRRSMADAGVMTGAEIDRGLQEKVFLFIHKGMTRVNKDDGQVYGPRERTDRIIQLKAHTRWGAYYLMRENLLGTLEPGKFADFMVLDRDFLAIPDDDIPNIQVLMTVVGGKTVHLGDALAREVGMQPVGPTTWREQIPPGWHSGWHSVSQ